MNGHVLTMERRLRIALCNLQTGIGTTRGYWHYLTTGWKYVLPHGSAPVERAARFVDDAAVDLLALCEVEGGSRRTRGVDQVRLLAERSRLNACAFFPTLSIGTRVNQGNAVCSRYAVRHVDNHLLPGTGEPRYLSEAEVLVEGIPVRVFVTHLSLQRQVRTGQIDHIAAFIDDVDGPTLLAGDFNASTQDELLLLAESRLQQATSAPTFPSWKPVKALDHLFFSAHFRVEHVEAHRDDLFSDHLPLVAQVLLAPEAAA